METVAPRPRKEPDKDHKIKVGDFVRHERSGNAGYVKRIYGTTVAVVERRDLPKTENAHGTLCHPCYMSEIKNLVFMK